MARRSGSIRRRAARVPRGLNSDTVGRRCCSDSGDDLDPSFVHRLEPLSLLLRTLVWDGADEVVAPAVLIDLARVPLVALINWPNLSPTS